MTGKRIKAAPTKNTLLNLKRQLNFLEEGHSLLERKRELLTRLVYQRIGEYRKIRDQAHEATKLAYHWLSMLQLRMGSRAVNQAALGVEPVLDLKILPRRNLGVEYPSVSGQLLPLNPVGLLGTDPSFDETRQHFAEASLQLAKMGEVSMSLNRLIAEQRKAQKRVNALRYNIIPQYRNTIRFIENALEEEERNALFQVKVLRDQERI
ncbi:MAG: V-type ATP synthase subunit D [Candidatus Thiodiazotropha sp. (ex Lucina aurantia)]|nr:V-type ATP synthase subunit D [Candidatus Thiodiazotropha taylori]MBV2099184.1 V-type ATP synthase subunit D [Candidatus Thiodiazotropha sp. (ex Codakia orbicularis)]MBV2103516.1 V-type ATP synthase subunit D [Candidatus Thiodiazotropha sp. (ex Lucina aurantia)]MBV2118080.1 V-type ATP synthase subunit D [Candidatus Thiodiazotropha sp. (ex Lucina aurantia)]